MEGENCYSGSATRSAAIRNAAEGGGITYLGGIEGRSHSPAAAQVEHGGDLFGRCGKRESDGKPGCQTRDQGRETKQKRSGEDQFEDADSKGMERGLRQKGFAMTIAANAGKASFRGRRAAAKAQSGNACLAVAGQKVPCLVLLRDLPDFGR
jgi:hypothetical protein